MKVASGVKLTECLGNLNSHIESHLFQIGRISSNWVDHSVQIVSLVRHQHFSDRGVNLVGKKLGEVWILQFEISEVGEDLQFLFEGDEVFMQIVLFKDYLKAPFNGFALEDWALFTVADLCLSFDELWVEKGLWRGFVLCGLLVAYHELLKIILNL